MDKEGQQQAEGLGSSGGGGLDHSSSGRSRLKRPLLASLLPSSAKRQDDDAGGGRGAEEDHGKTTKEAPPSSSPSWRGLVSGTRRRRSGSKDSPGGDVTAPTTPLAGAAPSGGATVASSAASTATSASSTATGHGSAAPLTIVLVGGFLLPPTQEFHTLYWGEALNFPQHRLLCVHPGPIASLHDRVCQIFYELKGGRVNYGHGHSAKFGHDCFGQDFPGLYPEWDADHPIHLIGHSFGGMTVRLLMHYLEKKAFVGYDTSPDWVRSMSTINSPHNGTHLVYGLGADPSHPPIVHWGSPGYMLGTMAHIVEFLDLPALRRTGLDFALGYWQLSWRYGVWKGLGRIAKAVLGLSNICTTADNAAYDMTVHAAINYNEMTTTYPGIFYFSFVGTCARHRSPPSSPTNKQHQESQQKLKKKHLSHHHLEAEKDAEEPDQRTTRTVKYLAYKLMGWHVRSVNFREHGIFDEVRNPGKGAEDASWTTDGESDGVVSVFSQAFPRVPREEPHQFGLPEDPQDLISGQWYVTELPVDHMGVVGYPHSHQYQARFFEALYALLEHCQTRGGALATPSTPGSLQAKSPLSTVSSTGMGLATPRSTGGARDFTWEALSAVTPSPSSSSSSSTTSSVGDAVSPPIPPLPIRMRLGSSLSTAEIRRLERRGSWALARQNSTCQCYHHQHGGEGGDAHTPTTRMLLCEECNRGLRRQESVALWREPKAEPLGVWTWLLLVVWLVPFVVMLYENPLFFACSLGWLLFFWLVHALVLHVLPAPASLSVSTPRAKSLWSLGVVGILHACIATVVAVLLFSGLAYGEGRSTVVARVTQEMCNISAQVTTSVGLAADINATGGGAGMLNHLLTVQLLMSCGYYVFNLFTQVHQRLQRRHPTSLAWQTLLLFFYTATLHRDDLHVSFASSLSATTDNTVYLQRLLAFAILGEMHNGLVMLRDVLVLAGYLQAPPADVAEFMRRQKHVGASPYRPGRVPNPQVSTPAHMKQTRLAAFVWVSIWVTFFLCQCFPMVYLFVLFSSRFFVLDLVLFKYGFSATSAVGWAFLVAAYLNIGRMKTLSERFQLDFWKVHQA